MDYNLTSDIPYATNGHFRQKLDIYTPKQPTNGPLPLVIWIHGGAFKFGTKEESKYLPTRLTKHNYAVASINYRLSGHAIFPAAVQDCKAAVRFLRANSTQYNLDPARFVVMGESAGGYMAIMVGVTGSHPSPLPQFDAGENLDTSSAVQGVIDYYGPTDFLAMDDHAPSGSPHVHNAADSPESLFLGAQITTVPELVESANPISYVSEMTPPFLIAHGDGDVVVPYHQSLLLVEALRRYRESDVLHEVKGTDHVFEGMTGDQEVELDRTVDEFLARIFGK